MAKRRAVLLTVEGSPPVHRSCHERGEHARRRWPHHSGSGRVEPADARSHRLARRHGGYGSTERLRASDVMSPKLGRKDLTCLSSAVRNFHPSRSAHWVSAALLINSPLTTDLSAWYAGDGLASALTLAGLAVDGFIVSLGGQSLFGGWLLGDE